MIDIKDMMKSGDVPDVVLEIADLIGYANTLNLVNAIGGLDFSVPTGEQESTRKDVIISAIGEESAYEFMEVYGGDRLYIPKCKNAFAKIRNERFVNDVSNSIREGFSQKFAIQQLAVEYDISERWAYELIKKARQKDKVV